MFSTATNYHSHCSFCDGRAPMEDFVQAAIAEHFVAYGISSHAPQPFDYKWTMSYEEMPAYLNEFNRLKNKYAGEIELYVGLEIDYLDEINNPAHPYYQQLPLDYRMGSVHVIQTPEGRSVDIDAGPGGFEMILYGEFGGDLQKLVTTYFDASMRMVETGGFDFIGHCDKIHHNIKKVSKGFTDTDWYKSKLKEYFSLVAEKEIMIEINTKSYRKIASFFPDESVFGILNDMKIPVLVNSDAHLPEYINSSRQLAIDLLKASGFRTIRQLLGGKWQDTEI